MPWLGLDKFQKDLSDLARNTDLAVRESVAKGAALIESKAKSNFEGSHKRGEPHVGGDKPNVVTGATRRSIIADKVTQTGYASYMTIVGPRVEWARRLDQGFSGTDSIGRTYDQPPFPYFTPAVEDAIPELASIQEETFKKYIHI